MTSLSLRLALRLIRQLATISGRQRFIDGFCTTTTLVYNSKSLEVQVMLLFFMVSFETIGRVPHVYLPRAFAFNPRFLLIKCRSSSSRWFGRSETVLLLLFSVVDNDRKLMRPSSPNVEVVPYRISRPQSLTPETQSMEWESMM